MGEEMWINCFVFKKQQIYSVISVAPLLVMTLMTDKTSMALV